MFRSHDVTLVETALSQPWKFQNTLNYIIMQSPSHNQYLKHLSVLGAEFAGQ